MYYFKCGNSPRMCLQPEMINKEKPNQIRTTGTDTAALWCDTVEVVALF